MGIFKRKKRGINILWPGVGTADDLCIAGYAPLSKNPEVQAAANYIAGLIASMTIYLMRNTKNGDERIKNELSRKIDINPWSLTTRESWMYGIVKNMLIEGNQIVIPKTENGFIRDLIPAPPSSVSIITYQDYYQVTYNGRIFEPDEVLHFMLNPDPQYPYMGQGYRVELRNVVQNLAQAAKTTKGFLESKWKPSVIIKVDALTEEFASQTGRQNLLNSYISTAEAGTPWMIPAEQFEVEQVKPLSLNDLAIKDTVEIDKKTVAGIMGVPQYVLGVGTFNKDEHRNFITTRIMPIAQSIAQELTKKLLISPDLYFTFSARSLYSYDISELATVGESLYQMGLATGNEVRGWLNMPPLPDLNNLVMLENYIPASMIGDQKKLNQATQTTEGEQNGEADSNQ